MPRTPTTEARRNPAVGVHGTIVLAIGEDIARGTIKPGERLPREAELIERFRASRTAIREAMKVLTAKGLVLARQRAGTKVRPRAWPPNARPRTISRRCRPPTNKWPGPVDQREGIEAHGRVIDRIRVRDRAGAERAMRAVIGRAKVESRRRRSRIAVAGRDAP